MDLTKDLEIWLSKRSLWIQNAISRIINKGYIDEEDIVQLVELCKKEAGILKDINGDLKEIKFNLRQINNEEITNDLIIESISNLTGMFALAPRKPLELGKNKLTAVYGRNGSGKSSYVKVLKHMCGAINPGLLISNIFEDKNEIKGCKIDIKIGDKRESICWKQEDGVSDRLKEIEIYDTDCAEVYVNSEKEVTYEPWILTLLTKLTEVCTKVGEEIEKEIRNNISKKPNIPKEYIDTESGKCYLNMSYRSKKDILSVCEWNSELEGQLQILREKLSIVNSIEKSKNINLRVSSINKLIQSIKDLEIGLSDEVCNEYLTLKKEANFKRKVAYEDVDRVLNLTSLDGIGTESWKLLWEQARQYSEKVAYKDNIFPNVSDGARCILCQQLLGDEAKNRLTSFESFIKASIQIQATVAENKLKGFENKIINVPENSVVDLIISSCGIVDEKEIDLIKSVYNSYRIRRESLLKATNIDEIVKAVDINFIEGYRKQIESFKEIALTLEKDNKNENKEIIERNIVELEAKKWVHQQSENIYDELERLKMQNALEKAKKLTNTKAISDKKSDISNKLVTEEYVNRFKNELKALGAYQIKVELVKTKAQKGRIFHQIKLKNCKEKIKTREVLSEGEMRIISLAAFLADVESRKAKTPLIFDDPISSLDQEYEEATVERLVELSKNKQVIVFTHRISLVTLIEELANKHNIGTNVISLRKEVWGAGEPNETPINVKKPEAALNLLMNDRLSKANKILNEFGQVEYEPIAKAICSNFRIIVERFVENKLLCDVVQRFRRSINTLGKLEKIPLITVDDCKLFDELMTKYSKYEHSQSVELPVFSPSIEELRSDMEKLKKWNEEFKKRTK